MSEEPGRSEAGDDEHSQARRASGAFWLRQAMRIPDFGEIAGGWAELPRGGKWLVAAIVVVLIMVVPVVAIGVALLN